MDILSGFPDDILGYIVSNITDVESIENLRIAYPYMSDLISSCIIGLESKELKFVDFKYYYNMINLVYTKNIIFTIMNSYELLNLAKFLNLCNISIMIDHPLIDEYESLHYLEYFIKNLFDGRPSPRVWDKTFRLVFTIKEKQDFKYAYILDRGLFSILNFNQITSINSLCIDVHSKVWLYATKLSLVKLLKLKEIKECYYSNNLEFDCKVLLDQVNNPNSNILVMTLKLDNFKELYIPNEYVKMLIKNVIPNFDITAPNLVIDKLTIKLLIFKYYICSENLIDHDTCNIKLKKDPIFKTYFPIKKNQLIKINSKLYNTKVNDIFADLKDDLIDPDNLLKIILLVSQPADRASDEMVLTEKLPPCNSYIKTKEYLKMVDTIGLIADNLK